MPTAPQPFAVRFSDRHRTSFSARFEPARLAVVAGLGVVELWVVGMMFESFSPHDQTRAAVEPLAATRRILATGPAPHVLIDDDGATLNVTVRPGNTVVISTATEEHGLISHAQPVQIERTVDGVTVVRDDGGIIFSLGGSIDRRLDVIVPPAASIDVKSAGAITVAGLRGAATLHSDDGSIVVSDSRGALAVQTDGGRIALSNVATSSLDIQSDDGNVMLDHVRSGKANIKTDDGRIDVARSVLGGGKIESDTGAIRLALDSTSNVTLSAHTSSGTIRAEAPLRAMVAQSDDDARQLVRLGDGSGLLDVADDDGSITVSAGRQ